MIRVRAESKQNRIRLNLMKKLSLLIAVAALTAAPSVFAGDKPAAKSDCAGKSACCAAKKEAKATTSNVNLHGATQLAKR